MSEVTLDGWDGIEALPSHASVPPSTQSVAYLQGNLASPDPPSPPQDHRRASHGYPPPRTTIGPWA